MSLINQMLKDLEARRSHQGGAMQQEVLLDVQAVPEQEPCSWRRTLLSGGLLLVLLSGFGWWGYRALSPPVVAPVVKVAPVVVSVQPEIQENYGNDEPHDSNNSIEYQVVTRAAQSKTQLKPLSKPARSLPTPVVQTHEVTPPVSMAVTKVERPVSQQEQAEASFQRALASQRAGQRATMETELSQALEQDPSHLLARETLVAVLYRAGRLDEAKQVLLRGMTGSSAPLPLRKILARILLDQGEPEEAALALVQGRTPTAAQDTEFHQLLAAIYQRTGQFTAAAQTYRQLLGVQRKTGVWWLGLGLALESGRSLPGAKEAYRTALEDPALQPGLGDFVRSRLAALAAPN